MRFFPKTKFRRAVESFMHDQRARERGLETELHVAKRDRDRYRAEAEIRRIGREPEPIVSFEAPSWRRWFRLGLNRQTYRRVWEVQSFNADGQMVWYSHAPYLDCLRAIFVAERICGGERMGYRQPDSSVVKVRHVERGTVAWSGRVR